MADKVESKSAAAAAAAAAAASKPSEKRSTAIDLIIGESVKADQFQHTFIHSTDPRLFPWQSSSNACLVLACLLVLFVSAGSSSPYSYGYSILALIIDRIRDAAAYVGVGGDRGGNDLPLKVQKPLPPLVDLLMKYCSPSWPPKAAEKFNIFP